MRGVGSVAEGRSGSAAGGEFRRTIQSAPQSPAPFIPAQSSLLSLPGNVVVSSSVPLHAAPTGAGAAPADPPPPSSAPADPPHVHVQYPPSFIQASPHWFAAFIPAQSVPSAPGRSVVSSSFPAQGAGATSWACAPRPASRASTPAAARAACQGRRTGIRAPSGREGPSLREGTGLVSLSVWGQFSQCPATSTGPAAAIFMKYPGGFFGGRRGSRAPCAGRRPRSRAPGTDAAPMRPTIPPTP